MTAELCVCGVDTGPPCGVQGCLTEPGERETATHQGGQLGVAAFTLQKRSPTKTTALPLAADSPLDNSGDRAKM